MATRNSGDDVGGDTEAAAAVCAPASKRPARDRIFETARERFHVQNAALKLRVAGRAQAIHRATGLGYIGGGGAV